MAGLTALPRELLRSILAHLLRSRRLRCTHNYRSCVDLLHACLVCKVFVAAEGGGSLLELVSKDMLDMLELSPYHRSALPDAQSLFGVLTRHMVPRDLLFMAPTGRDEIPTSLACHRKYLASALRAVGVHLQSGTPTAHRAYSVEHRWLYHQGIGARTSHLMSTCAGGTRAEALVLRVLSDHAAGLPSRWWVSMLCLHERMSTDDIAGALEVLCHEGFVLADRPEQMALPLNLRLSYDVCLPSASDGEAEAEAASGLGAMSRGQLARVRNRITFETTVAREPSGDGSEASEESNEEDDSAEGRARFATKFVWLRSWSSDAGSLERAIATAHLTYEGDGNLGGPCISSLQLAHGVEVAVAEALLAEIESFAAHVHPARGLHITRTVRQKGSRRRARPRAQSRPLFPDEDS